MHVTRGFRSRGARDPRLPPGQYDAGAEWPVLTAEATPTLSTGSWTFVVEGLVERPPPAGPGMRCGPSRNPVTTGTFTA
jgi:hypothetical protein